MQVRGELAANITLSGGNTKFPNFDKRSQSSYFYHIASHHNIMLYHQMNLHDIIFLHKVSSKLHYLIILEDPLLIISAIRNPAITIMSDCHDNVSQCNKTLRYIIARLGAELSCLLPEGQEARVKALPNR